MEFSNTLFFIGAIIVLSSVFVGQLSSRIGSPILLTYLCVGIFFGEDGPGGIQFDDIETAFTVCSLALAIILFDGGVRTPMRIFKASLANALLLSTLGVLATASITGAFAAWVLDVDLIYGLLLGAIVASTDAAAVFLLLQQRGIQLAHKVKYTLEVESGINDPMAVFLTITCVELLKNDISVGWAPFLFLFMKQMLIGLFAGIAGGHGMTYMLKRLKLDAGLYPIVTLAFGLLIYGGANLMGGSGFLAVYLAGLTFAASGYARMTIIKQFSDGLAWMAQLIMMLVLGLLVTPSQLLQYLAPALWVSMALLFVARPAGVWVCMLGSGFKWQEKTFISWVGLRGAVPIYLALIPAMAGIPSAHYYFNTAFIIVFISLLLQGWTVNPLAKKLGLITPD
ncbi:MAG: potassium/proton antiporter [Alphaproteobacteria bacterium]|nr:potassium/proton antiporter [Alphaproteobacteria bacterium]